jgi:hypothetical protein
MARAFGLRGRRGSAVGGAAGNVRRPVAEPRRGRRAVRVGRAVERGRRRGHGRRSGRRYGRRAGLRRLGRRGDRLAPTVSGLSRCSLSASDDEKRQEERPGEGEHWLARTLHRKKGAVTPLHRRLSPRFPATAGRRVGARTPQQRRSSFTGSPSTNVGCHLISPRTTLHIRRRHCAWGKRDDGGAPRSINTKSSGTTRR